MSFRPVLRRSHSPLKIAAGCVLGAVTLAGGVALARDGDAAYKKLRVFTQVLTHIEQSYVESVPEEQLIYGAVNGMMATLDPHSAFMTPEEFRKLKDDTAGEFGGLGLEITQKDGVITILAPVEGAPGARAGLQAGDAIIGVDGVSLEETRLQDAWKLLRGSAGTKVTLRIRRAAWPEPRDVALIRERVKVQSVEQACLEPGFGQVRIKSFQDRVGRDLEAALASLTTSCAREPGKGLSGLVLDLRGNPGGLLEEAVRVADAFLWEGDIVSTEARNHRPVARQRAHPKDTQPNYPMVVLVNDTSASASEIVAGALQDHGRAVIMGTQTFGKGSVQTVMELEDGSGLKLTVARYFTPHGRSIQELGITPDVVVEAGSGLPEGDGEKASQFREKDLKRHLKNATAATPAAVPERKDVQLSVALGYLRSWRIFAAGQALGKDAQHP